MKMNPDGLWYFSTEMPGDESQVGWGDDPEAHIHYDVICSGCAANQAFNGPDYQYWSKFYPEDVCTLKKCGVPGPAHQASGKFQYGGATVYKYDFVLPTTGKA
jgi:hypothetical protein